MVCSKFQKSLFRTCGVCGTKQLAKHLVVLIQLRTGYDLMVRCIRTAQLVYCSARKVILVDPGPLTLLRLKE